jgi:hypothetical protein
MLRRGLKGRARLKGGDMLALAFRHAVPDAIDEWEAQGSDAASIPGTGLFLGKGNPPRPSFAQDTATTEAELVRVCADHGREFGRLGVAVVSRPRAFPLR